MGTDDTAKVEKKKERRMAIMEKVLTYLLMGGAAGGVGYGASKATPSEVVPVQNVRDIGAEKRAAEEEADRKIIIDKLGKVETRLDVIGKTMDVDKAAMQRDLSDLRTENRELRANDKEQDKRLAKLEAEKGK